MTLSRQSDIFKGFFTLWKFLGIWFGRNPTKKQRRYACLNILLNQVFFSTLLTISLFYAPRQIQYLVPELIFYFTEIDITSKCFMIIIKRDKIIEAFNLMDREDLGYDDDSSKLIVEKDRANYITFWRLFNVLAHVTYWCLVCLPLIIHFTLNVELKCVISQFYFLDDEFRAKYIYYIFAYQSTMTYMHMLYNITVDAFGAGLMLTAVTQLKVLNSKLKNLKLSAEESMLSFKEQEDIQTARLRSYLSRYELCLRYCNLIQDILSFNMFMVFGLGSLIVGVVMCQLILPTPIGLYLSMFTYLVAMLLKIFLPAYMGSLIYYESRELVFAAYCVEWIPRSESFKRSIRIFVERANSPIQITGLKIFTLSLFTFTSICQDFYSHDTDVTGSRITEIIKTAYSFFALIRRFQE